MRFVLVLLLGVAICAALPRQDQNKIIGGYETTINQYPYAVALLLTVTGSFFTQSCGGSILNNRSVLTAAHCFGFYFGVNSWRSRVGSTWANSGGEVFLTSQIIRHPNYNSASQDNDIAIIRISGAINWVANTIAPASIAGANYNLADNQVVWAIGWGVTNSGFSSEHLRHVQIWTVNQQVCAQRYAEVGAMVTNNMLCAGWLDVGGRDQCQGDSGGPLLHNNVVVGVCSWGFGCAQARYPGVNARVSTASNWIVANA